MDEIVQQLKRQVRRWKEPIVTQIARRRDPFRVLVSTLLSLRTKDATTAAASERLFALADTPDAMLKLSSARIARTIFPVGFYKTKARTIRAICRVLLEDYGGRVPDDLDELLKLKGVGRKTANLVVTLGYGKPGICVDTHVHRITNRWGYVKTKTPDETEMRLREILPRKHWIVLNDLLVTYGQNLCKPISPRCSECVIAEFCEKVGVGRSR
ncbi:MAG TPA: endonuclease III [Firmicutes bacterium]|nr:endonuclease III [Bacillota bacterium]